jgi:hypothetical protein
MATSKATRRAVSGRARLGALVACVVVASVVLTGCAGTGYNYVKSSDYHTYFKVPERWKLYDTKALLDPKVSGLTKDEAATAADSKWLTAFDSSPAPNLSHLFRAQNHPWGFASVQQISASKADTVSLSSLRNLFFDIDGTDSGAPADVVSYDPIALAGGFHGSHLVAKVALTNGKTLTVNQVALLDEATSKIYALVVSCTTSCYEKNHSKIEQIVNSWTVRDS